MARASGSRAHAGDDLVGGAGFGRDPCLAEPPRASISCASASPSTSSVSGTAPSAATRPVSSFRLVTTTREPGRAGQQGPHLGAVARVVQDDQHLPVIEQAAEQRGPALGVGRDPVRRTPSASRKKRSASAGSIAGWPGKAAQVDVQLAAGEPLGDPMAEPDGERGLPRPRRARDDHDRDRLIRLILLIRALLAGLRPRRGGRTRHASRAASSAALLEVLHGGRRNPARPAGAGCAGTGVALPSGLGRRCPPSGAGPAPAPRRPA